MRVGRGWHAPIFKKYLDYLGLRAERIRKLLAS